MRYAKKIDYIIKAYNATAVSKYKTYHPTWSSYESGMNKCVKDGESSEPQVALYTSKCTAHQWCNMQQRHNAQQLRNHAMVQPGDAMSTAAFANKTGHLNSGQVTAFSDVGALWPRKNTFRHINNGLCFQDCCGSNWRLFLMQQQICVEERRWDQRNRTGELMDILVWSGILLNNLDAVVCYQQVGVLSYAHYYGFIWIIM